MTAVDVSATLCDVKCDESDLKCYNLENSFDLRSIESVGSESLKTPCSQVTTTSCPSTPCDSGRLVSQDMLLSFASNASSLGSKRGMNLSIHVDGDTLSQKRKSSPCAIPSYRPYSEIAPLTHPERDYHNWCTSELNRRTAKRRDKRSNKEPRGVTEICTVM